MFIQSLVPLTLALVGATLEEQSIENYQLWWEGEIQNAVNATACDNADTSINFSLQPDNASPTVNSDGKLYIWWPASNDDSCTSPEDDDALVLVDGRVSDDSSGYFSDSSFTFPTEAELTFTYQTVYERVSDSFCSTSTTTNRTEVRLCIGIEHPEPDLGGATEREVFIDEMSELRMGIDFIVDSTPPSTPTVANILPRDGSIQFDATIDEETPYLKQWLVRSQENDGSTSSCDTWGEPIETVIAVSGSETNTQSLNFDATNGVDYMFCVIAVDDANNQSTPSETQLATARDECDFIECYPGELETGHCGATGRDTLWVLFFMLICLRLGQHRRQPSC